jgi:hypothetical protein
MKQHTENNWSFALVACLAALAASVTLGRAQMLENFDSYAAGATIASTPAEIGILSGDSSQITVSSGAPLVPVPLPVRRQT